MKEVFSTANSVKGVEIGYDTVYLRYDIQRSNDSGIIGWSYLEEELTKDEFITRLSEENIYLKNVQAEASATLLELMEVVLLGGI